MCADNNFLLNLVGQSLINAQVNSIDNHIPSTYNSQVQNRDIDGDNNSSSQLSNSFIKSNSVSSINDFASCNLFQNQDESADNSQMSNSVIKNFFGQNSTSISSTHNTGSNNPHQNQNEIAENILSSEISNELTYPPSTIHAKMFKVTKKFEKIGESDGKPRYMNKKTRIAICWRSNANCWYMCNSIYDFYINRADTSNNVPIEDGWEQVTDFSNCPRGHELRKFMRKHKEVECSKCRKNITKEMILIGCRYHTKCGYHLCTNCATLFLASEKYKRELIRNRRIKRRQKLATDSKSKKR
jgi:hypothetical protein